MMIETLKSFKYETKQTCRERAWMNGLKKRKKWRRWCSLVDDNGDDDEHCYHHYTQPEKKQQQQHDQMKTETEKENDV